MKKGFWQMVGFVTLLVAGGGAWFFLTVGEWNGPKIAAEGDTSVIGRQKVLTVAFSDAGRGLRRVSVAVTQDNQRRPVATFDYPGAGVGQKSLSVTIDTAVLKLHDGPATLTLTAEDYSLWKNKTAIELPVTIDLMPPQIAQLNSTHHINPGGSCLVTYRLSKPVVRTGVQVGDLFFPGYPLTPAGQSAALPAVQPAAPPAAQPPVAGQTAVQPSVPPTTHPVGQATYAAYFALPMDLTKDTKIALVALDQAGNETLSGIPTQILNKKYRSDKMLLSDGFFNQKMPEFQATIPELRGKPLFDVFLHVNTVLRKQNLLAIQEVGKKTEPRVLWEGPFLRMKNAAPMALFGDHRTYLYEGKQVSESIHNGVDLASLVQAPIEAANHGVVRFTGPIGIYGNSVIVDHGLGLMTLYSHMSAIQAQVGQTVKKGDVLGKSGMTGLAAGDHLHFGVAIHGQFVDPKEWWDPHWIEDNVTKKMTAAY
ncbi:MAG: M23 family metallopeptidase [Deltaproteobacteria bacterium]|nr:M23 family metallopeptidase [Deltaproteobacteria bacterium]